MWPKTVSFNLIKTWNFVCFQELEEEKKSHSPTPIERDDEMGLDDEDGRNENEEWVIFSF